jgi:hypothetical protein
MNYATLDEMRRNYADAIIENDVDSRIMTYVDALYRELEAKKEYAYCLKCELEDAKLRIFEMAREAQENADV